MTKTRNSGLCWIDWMKRARLFCTLLVLEYNGWISFGHQLTRFNVDGLPVAMSPTSVPSPKCCPTFAFGRMMRAPANRSMPTRMHRKWRSMRWLSNRWFWRFAPNYSDVCMPEENKQTKTKISNVECFNRIEYNGFCMYNVLKLIQNGSGESWTKHICLCSINVPDRSERNDPISMA